MDEHGLECLLITGNNSIWERGWANIRWVTNYMGTMELDCTCVFPREGDPMLAILGLNARLPDRIARSIVTDVRGAAQHGRHHRRSDQRARPGARVASASSPRRRSSTSATITTSL